MSVLPSDDAKLPVIVCGALSCRLPVLVSVPNPPLAEALSANSKLPPRLILPVVAEITPPVSVPMVLPEPPVMVRLPAPAMMLPEIRLVL